jgi:2-polyprenyl-3-methyl-5-hydroxy-6-metoxy-1,4-benzoquinol methylase
MDKPALVSDAWDSLSAPAEFRSNASNVAPTIATEPVPNCPVCGETRFTFYAVGFDYEILTCANPWRFVRCDSCHHVWLHPRPALSTLSTIYPPHYYAYQYQKQINPLAVWGKAVLDRFKMRTILRYLPHPPRTFLDVGCGDGRFLKVMEGRGLARTNLYGLELDRAVVQTLAEAGYQVFAERVEDCQRIPPGTIDLATMFHVIEHVENPGAVVSKMASWLAPGGLFAVETPNLDSLDARLFRRRYWGGYHFPRHWNLFTPTSLSRLLTAQGLEVLGVRYQTGHSFWLWSFHHRLRYRHRPCPRLAELFNPFRGLPFLVLATAFDKMRATLGFRTSAMLMLARKPIQPNR